MKNRTPDRRCSQCTRPFDPDPRVGDRQATCGEAQCQRERHCERCRAWHVANADVASSHYEDVVRPFRERQPDYQQRWRLGRRLREIREEMPPLGGLILAGLRALLGRAEVLAESPTKEAQTGVLAAKALDAVKVVLRGAIAAIEQLEASVAALHAMGL